MHNQFEFLFIYFTRFSFAIRGLPVSYFPLLFLISFVIFFFFVISLCGLRVLLCIFLPLLFLFPRCVGST